MKTTEIKAGPLLDQINSPSDLKKLSPDQLNDVCFELRDYIIDMVSVHGGHFGASLGVVELTVALHYVLNTPEDRLVWDVGHQAYGHKILTGRRDSFHTNRKYKGLSGFPKRSESPYDSFGVGHSSTSISAGLGMAVASDMKGENRNVISVIGDGAMTGGIAFEALNNAGSLPNNITVILNDNNMSIDPNVGALKEYLADITTSQTFNKIRDEVYDMLGHFRSAGDKMRKVASRMESALTSALTPGGLFRALGFKYYGPVDGHNVKGLVRNLEDLKRIPGPKLLHIVTVKGKGFAPAEKDQVKWHAQGSPFDKITGKSLLVKKAGPSVPKYQDVFADAVIELAKQDERVVAVTPAMPSGTGLLKMMKEMPDRCFDVGIAEQHAVTFAAGMATEGKIPFAGIYSTFLQRGYDQVIHDVAIQQLPVVFCMDRAGLVGADGPTHHGLYDIAYMRCLPNMVLCAPMNEQELRDMLFTATCHTDRSFGIRYPRGKATGMPVQEGFTEMELGKGECIRKGTSVAVLSYGVVGNHVIEAAEELSKAGIEIGHYNMRFVKPLDTEMIDMVALEYDHIITLEDGVKQGGFGSAIAEYLAEQPHRVRMTILGTPDRLVEHGTQQELYKEVGIDAGSIVNRVKALVPSTPQPVGRH